MTLKQMCLLILTQMLTLRQRLKRMRLLRLTQTLKLTHLPTQIHLLMLKDLLKHLCFQRHSRMLM